jgi:hypothetical protein
MFTSNVAFQSDLRIDFGKILEFNLDFYDILTSEYVVNLKNLPVAGTFRVVTERFRPDLISYRIYDDEQYKHILMVYNDLVSYKQILPGLTLAYPSLLGMQSLLFSS